MTQSARLKNEYLQNNAANQILANTTTERLDQQVQATVKDKDLITPPGSPSDGDAYIVASGNWGTGSSKAGQIAFWSAGQGAWQFIVPFQGYRAGVVDEIGADGLPTIYGWTGSAWTVAAAGGGGTAGLPPTSKSTDYTLVLGDANLAFLHPSADTTARTWTIPSNASVAFPIGTLVTFVNQNSAGILTISITTDTMRLAGAGTTGSRTLVANGIATAWKLTSTEWIISGVGLT